MGIYQDNKDAMEFFRNSKQLESNGKWQEFVEQSELEAAVHEPRNMAHGGRIGFEPGGPVRKNELIKVLGDSGITTSSSNFSKVMNDLDIKKDTKHPLHRKTQPIYIEPTKKELIIKKKTWDKNQLLSFHTGPGREAYELREKRIIELLKKGDLTQSEIDKAIRTEFGTSSKTTIIKLKKKLKIKLPDARVKGPLNVKTAKIIKDLNILKNSEELNNLILKSDFNLMKDLPELEKIATKMLPKTTADPVRRVGQLLLAYSGEDSELQKYVGEVSDDLVKASGVVKTKMNKSSRLLSTLQKIASEKRAAGELGKDPAFFGSQRKRLNEIINSLKKGLNIEVDEAKAIGGAKAKTPAYNLFVQGVKDTVNQKKGETLDRLTQTAELELQNEKKKAKKIKIKDTYNKEVKDFVANANKNLKPGQLPVRALEISFDPPSETIKNKAAYNEYKPYFDDVYTKHKYSFKVPKDVMTSEQAKTFLKTDKGQAQLLKQIDLGSQRLYSFPAMLENPKFVAKEAMEGAKLLGKGLGKGLGGIDLPLVQAAFAYDDPTNLAYSLPFTKVAADVTGITKPAATKAGQVAKNVLSGIGPKRLAKYALPVSRISTPFGLGMAMYDIAKASKPNYYIDPQTQEPTFYDRENAADVLPTMMDIYDQAYNIAKKENISYQEALNKVNPERFYKLKND